MAISFHVLRELCDTAQKYPQKVAIVLDGQTWTYSELIEEIERVVCHLHSLNVVQGQIIYQFVERGFEMICGYFGITCAGGVYCPINPTEPLDRVIILLEQMQGQYVLLHEKTRSRFPSTAVQLVTSLDTVLYPFFHLEDTTDPPVCSGYGAAYIICTSGTTGRPKAIVHTHKSFSASINTYIQWNVRMYTSRDHVLQVATSSWVLHLMEIPLALVVGGTLVLLRPGGQMDMAYFCETLIRQQVTTLTIGPGLIRALIHYLETTQRLETFKSVRNLCTTGEAMKPQHWIRFITFLSPYNNNICLLYGMSECNGVLGCPFSSVDYTVVPIGCPLPDVRCLLIDEEGQAISVTDTEDAIGEIHIGGPNLFNCYLDDPKRTAKMFVNINNELYLKTGDLARYLASGQLIHAGRVDFQIKIRGQRVETAEIENTIINSSSGKISNCLVVKAPQNDDLLVAYLVSNDLELDVEPIRNYCRKHLSQYMIPTLFIVLEQLPLNASGKIDRKRLPVPDFSVLSTLDNDHENAESTDEIERKIQTLWCEILGFSPISTCANFFSIGGYSLLFIQLYQGYKTIFDFDLCTLHISEFFHDPTITSHAHLIRQAMYTQDTSATSLPSEDNAKIQTSYSRRSSLFTTDISSTLKTDLIIRINIASRYLPFPCTEVQQAYLFGRRASVDLGQVSCFEYREYDLPSQFNIEQFERSLNQLIQRCEALRIIFTSDIEQRILEKTPYYTIPICDLCNDTYVFDALVERRMQLSHQVRPANQWPLFDFQLTRFINKNGHQLRIHIGFDLLVADLWSLNLIFAELSQLYHNPDVILPTIEYSHRDYILEYYQMKDTLAYEKDKKYWIDRLHTFPFGTDLPLRCSLKELKVQRFIRAQQILDRSIWNQLKQRIKNAELTPAGFLASVYAIVLSKWSNQQHFVINLPIFNRLPIHPQVNQVVGDFTSILPLEVSLEPKLTFSEFTKAIQQQLWNDVAHMAYDGISFVRQLMRIHQTREIALPIVFTCGLFNSDLKGDTNKMHMLFGNNPVYSISQTPQVYLDNQVFEADGELIVRWDHVENLFPPSLINDMLNAFIHLLNRLASSDEMWQEPVFISLPAEQLQRRSVLVEKKWKSHVETRSLHSLIVEQAQRVPDVWAILSPRKNLTYQQLMDRVYPLAYSLQQQGIQSNQLVAILMKKGWEQVVACLAILIAGGAYLPLDVDSPYDRLSQIVEETNVKIILTQSDCQHVFPYSVTVSVDTFTFDKNPEPFPVRQQSSADLAYVIYTSGSTGKPKGVVISHQAVLNTILDVNARLEVSDDDRVFALSHLNFDLSVYDIFGMLISGGTIVIPDHDHYKDPQHWYDIMIKHRVTIWNSVPMLIEMLTEYLRHTYTNNQLRHVLLSGDWIPLSLPKSIETIFGEQVTITSLGGATEASIWSIAHTLPKDIRKEWKSIPYGTPLQNQGYYVYDAQLDDCPEWVNGELYIAGVGLANGYWNDQEKTKSSFLTHPRTGKRLYRTGDYGRFVPDGYIEFIGRKDFQVKVHGHRIELGEIEYHLQQHQDIHQAVVALNKNSQQLIGYVMPEKHSSHIDNYDQSEIQIIDPTERNSFKFVRHSIQYPYEVMTTFPLIKPTVTEKLINTYYASKIYRQFTNEVIEIDAIEDLLRRCHDGEEDHKISRSSVDLNTLSQLLSVLTPINVSNEPLPKYRYASAESLYPVQVHLELPTSISDIHSGVYYHNPDEHTLQLIDAHVNNEYTSTHLHLVGRSSAIAPLYGKTLGSQLCILETGYMMELLENEASKWGLTVSQVGSNKLPEHILKISEDDTHYCFAISSNEQRMLNDTHKNNPLCIIYLKTVQNKNDQWFIYDKENGTVIPLDVGESTVPEEMPLLFDDDDDTKAIFHDCQGAIFFLGRSTDTIDIGKMSHALMNDCLKMNIGMCPIAARNSLPRKINLTLDRSLAQHTLPAHNLSMHTLLFGKISDDQKYDRSISKIKSMPKWKGALRAYLSEILPAYMIPNHFMTVSTFPLSSNGKIDRNSLPQISTLVPENDADFIAPGTELEKTIKNIWKQLIYGDRQAVKQNNTKSDKPPQIEYGIKCSPDDTVSNFSHLDFETSSQISTTTGFFDLGGDSLLLIQIYQRYQALFSFDAEVLTVRPFFVQNTLGEHAKLLETLVINQMESKQWHTLHINEGIASFAQERIFLDEQVRFSNDVAIYNELTIFRVVHGTLSVGRLQRAIRLLLNKHNILRTSLVFNDKDGTLRQSVTDQHQSFALTMGQTFRNDDELRDIIHQTTADVNLFDLSTARVISCQILRQQNSTSMNMDDEIIADLDVVVIAFHHAATDRTSGQIFCSDLCKAYNNDFIASVDEDVLQYIDYTVHERLMDMTVSRQFWNSELDGYNLQRPLFLTADRHRLRSNQRSGVGFVAQISFDNDVATAFLNYATSQKATLFQLGLATFYTFLFKLTHSQSDLCVSVVNTNRYRTELQNMIGMFIATVPHRLQFDSYWSFDQLVRCVQEKCVSILEHLHYPLQHIVADTHLDHSSVQFLETGFTFINISSKVDELSFDGATLQHVLLPQRTEATKFDFNLILMYDSTSKDNTLSCRFVCSQDIFDEPTVVTIARRFEYLVSQTLFHKSNSSQMASSTTPLRKLPFMLPEEVKEMKGLLFDRLPNVLDEGMYI